MEDFLSVNLPFWDSLNSEQQQLITQYIVYNKRPKGTTMSYDGNNCSGLQLLKAGQARIYIASPNGGQITLYRLVKNDVCVMSAACLLQNIDFEIHIEVEQDAEIYTIPKNIFSQISDEVPQAKDFILGIITSRLSDIMWVINNLVFSDMGKRLALTLLEHSQLAQDTTLVLTHDDVSKDLGTAREVVTRLLKQFQLDGIVKLSRGKIEILDMEKLKRL